jgi:putative oxidoreductase
MTVASSMHAARGFFNSKGGFEFPAVLGWSAAALALTGPGAVSLDHVLGHRFNRSWMRNLALVAAAPAALAVIAKRRRTVAAQTPPAETAAAQTPATQAPAAQPDPALEEASSR